MKSDELWIYMVVFILVVIVTAFIYIFCKQLIVVAIGVTIFLLFCFFKGGGMDKILETLRGDSTKSVVTAINTDTQESKASEAEANNVPLTSSDSDIVNFALQFVGNPYVWGGDSLTHGIDCSHYVWQVLRQTGHYNGEYMEAKYWAREGQKVSQDNIQAGDIIIYGVGPDDPGHGHIAIYDGQGLIIEAKGSAYGITHDRALDHGDRIIAIRRF